MGKPKQYRLELDRCGGDENRPTIFSKGHHGYEQFAVAVKAYTGDKIPTRPEVTQEWWRTVPYPRSAWGSGWGYIEATPRSRGAFPVTVYVE